MAGILVDVKVGANDKASVSVKGSLQHIITDDEAKEFRLYDHSLKQAIAKHHGKWPTNAALKHPCFHNVYKTYGWNEVMVKMIPVEAKVRSLDMQPIALVSKEFVNNSGYTCEHSGSLQVTESNTVTTSWHDKAIVKCGTKITGGMSFIVDGKFEASFEVSAEHQQGGSASKGVSIGSTNNVKVTLKPGEKVLAKLSASKGTLKISVKYRCEVEGQVAADYEDKFKGHHFWALDVKRVMESANLPPQREIWQDMEVTYFSKERVETLPFPKRQRTF